MHTPVKDHRFRKAFVQIGWKFEVEREWNISMMLGSRPPSSVRAFGYNVWHVRSHVGLIVVQDLIQA